jgi:hypothetical protein
VARPVTPREHYSTEIAQLSNIVRRTAVDGRIDQLQLAKIRQLVGELTNRLIAAQSGPLPERPSKTT